MGSIYKRGKKLWLRFKGPDGKWTQSPSGFEVGQEKQAREALRRLEDRLAANVEFGEPEKGPVTLARYAQRWLEQREGLVADLRTDESRLRHHVLPYIGDMALEDIRPRHLVDLFRQLRVQGAIAPKTVHNIYGVLKALFRDAHLADLVTTSPCILTRHQLGENVDKDPTWRATAVFTRAELEMLISDTRVPPDRQVLYALQGIAALRHGEAAGLRWKHYDPNTPVLGRLVIATSYDKGHTKTKRTRYMPVHPTLAAVLAEWKLQGWPEMMGRPPTPEDLVVPMPRPTNRGPRVEFGGMRTDHHSYKRLVKDMEALGLRHRRGHDLRRTMISLARTDGARKDILELCTHTPRKSGNTIDLYTTFPWEALCAEVAKLQVQRHERGQLARLPLAASGGKENPGSPDGARGLATSLATVSRKAESFPRDAEWRRRESNPRPKAFRPSTLRA